MSPTMHDSARNSLMRIRNFSIIAHVDHGKSTLSDRLIEMCGALSKREMKEQVLDSLSVERRRGITVKAQTVRLDYHGKDGQTYILNLMDTPGHVDFSYEVSRCLYACEGVLLLVDASQGVEAQTLANAYLAIERDLVIIPVINKVDIQGADVEEVKKQIKEIVGLDASQATEISAKQGTGVEAILEEIVQQIPPPKIPEEQSLHALLIDTWFDSFQGVVLLVRVLAGSFKRGQKIRLLASGHESYIEQVGYFSPSAKEVESLNAGEVGYIISGIKSIHDCGVGDTIVAAQKPYPEPLPGFQSIQPMVFCGFFPESGDDFPQLRAAVEKLALNDASFRFEVETSTALGMGLRCGFLGLLHLEIIRERLEEEFKQYIISSAPSVLYKVHRTSGQVHDLYNPADYPDQTTVRMIEEPWLLATIFTPERYVGGLLGLLAERRGSQRSLQYVSADRIMLEYELPLNEIVFDFHDRLKSISQGYASFDYSMLGYREGDLAHLSILINGEDVSALSSIVPRGKVEQRGRKLCERLKELIPRQQYRVAIQAAIGGRIVARETISAFRKDVTAKCYGGDVTRKRKLLEKQKEGKKRMRQVGSINIPQKVYIEALRQDY